MTCFLYAGVSVFNKSPVNLLRGIKPSQFPRNRLRQVKWNAADLNGSTPDPGLVGNPPPKPTPTPAQPQ